MADTKERRVAASNISAGRASARPSSPSLQSVHERFVAGEVDASFLN